VLGGPHERTHQVALGPGGVPDRFLRRWGRTAHAHCRAGVPF
jgi:hypothetical protein